MVSPNRSKRRAPSRIPHKRYIISWESLSGGSKDRPRMAMIEPRQSFRTNQLQALHGIVAVDLLDIELSHEIDRLLGDDLPRHHDRETRRIGNDKTRRHQIGAVFQTAIDLGIVQAKIFATRSVIGGKETAADIAFVGLLPGVAAEAVMEVREVRKIGYISHQAVDPRLEDADGVGAALREV